MTVASKIISEYILLIEFNKQKLDNTRIVDFESQLRIKLSMVDC